MTYINMRYNGVVSTMGQCSTRDEAQSKIDAFKKVCHVGNVYPSQKPTSNWKKNNLVLLEAQ